LNATVKFGGRGCGVVVDWSWVTVCFLHSDEWVQKQWHGRVV